MIRQIEVTLDILTPRWSVPLLDPCPLKGAKGGRSSGKSHERVESAVELIVLDPDFQIVCIREIQKSLKFSMKKLFEAKIRKFGLQRLFKITDTEIRRVNGEGLIIFQGMQDHTADSIKSLEGFDLALCEEAQSLSQRSIDLLEPTIRKPGSEIWMIWNPDQPDDAVEKLFKDNPDSILVHVNYTDNPWCPQKMIRLAEKTRRQDLEKYDHIWLGGYNTKSDAQVFKERFRVDDFTPDNTFGDPLYGMDFGFSNDPSCFVRCWIKENTLYIDQDAGRVGLDLDDTAKFFTRADPIVENYAIRADNSRPESISFLRKKRPNPEGGYFPYLPKIESVKKWPGSVEDGVEFIKTFDEIVIHERCQDMQDEARLYSYKTDKRTGDILPDIVDDNNHRWDAVRYALAPLIKQSTIIFEAL